MYRCTTATVFNCATAVRVRRLMSACGLCLCCFAPRFRTVGIRSKAKATELST